MDSSLAGAEHPASVRTGGGEQIVGVLRAAERIGGKPESDEAYRRAVYEVAILWFAAHHSAPQPRGPQRESQAHPAPDGRNGYPGDLRETSNNKSDPGGQEVPIPATRSANRAAEPGVVQRHHLHPFNSRLCIPGGHHGLVQPLRAHLAVVELPGDHVLSRCSPGGSGGFWEARHLQHGSGQPVHQRRFHRVFEGCGRGDQHGWPRAIRRQHLHRAAMAFREVRGGVPQGLPDASRGVEEPGRVLDVLRSRTPPSVAGLPHTGVRVPELMASRMLMVQEPTTKNSPPSGGTHPPVAGGDQDPEFAIAISGRNRGPAAPSNNPRRTTPLPKNWRFLVRRMGSTVRNTPGSVFVTR